MILSAPAVANIARNVVRDVDTYTLDQARAEYRVLVAYRAESATPWVTAEIDAALRALCTRAEYLHTAWGRAAEAHAAREARLRRLRAA